MLSAWKWSIHDCGYATRLDRSSGFTRRVYMHRMVMLPGPGQYVDHVNGDGLDNRRDNLRICSQTQNMANQRLMVTNTSGFKGVSWFADRSKWQAHISLDGRSTSLGLFADLDEAARAYDRAAREHWGEFALVNFPEAVS